jgi:hypothetical protein
MQRLVMLYLHVSCNAAPNRAISWNLPSYTEVNAFGFAATTAAVAAFAAACRGTPDEFWGPYHGP